MKQLDYKKINRYIKKIALGNNHALKELFEYTYENMYIVAEFYLNNKSNVEDILSQLYEKVIINSCKFQEDKNGYNWMYTITKNLALQNNKYEYRCSHIEDNCCELSANYIDPLKALIIEEAIELLNDKEQKLLYLIYWEGYTIKEISQMNNVPQASIYTLRSRIFKKLKKLLKDE